MCAATEEGGREGGREGERESFALPRRFVCDEESKNFSTETLNSILNHFTQGKGVGRA
jgi:hypothetical protein